MKSVFEYVDYRDFLDHFYEERKGRHSYFSYRYFGYQGVWLLKEAVVDYFRGSMDEVRIISKVHGPDRIRLYYTNQRSDDRLVTFK